MRQRHKLVQKLVQWIRKNDKIEQKWERADEGKVE